MCSILIQEAGSPLGVGGDVSQAAPRPAAISMSTHGLALSRVQTSLGSFTLRPGLTQVAGESFGHCLPCYNHQCPCHTFFLQPRNTDSCSPSTPRQVSNDQQREKCFQIFKIVFIMFSDFQPNTDTWGKAVLLQKNCKASFLLGLMNWFPSQSSARGASWMGSEGSKPPTGKRNLGKHSVSSKTQYLEEVTEISPPM